MPEATANGGTSSRARLRRAVLRLLIAGGAIVAVWLIAPSAARADEPSGLGDLLGGATDVVGETVGSVTGVVDEVVETTTEAVEQVAAPVEQVTDVATGTVEQVTGAVEQVTDVATGTVEQVAGAVEDVTDVATGTMEDVLGTATGTVEDVLETASATVEEAVEGVTSTAPGSSPAGTPEEPAAPVPDSRQATTAVVWEAPRPMADDPVPSEPVTPRHGLEVAVAPGIRHTVGDTTPVSGSPEPGPAPFVPGTPTASGSHLTELGSSLSLRSPSSSQDVGVLATTILIALVLVRWSRREAELRLSPAFLSLPERPG